MASRHEDVADALALIFEGIKRLQGACKNGRQFTIDGRLVGDIGELVAEREFELALDPVSRADYDAITADNRNVQIKATFKNSLTFKREPELYLGLLLHQNGEHEVIFNGPGRYITQRFKDRRKGFGEKLVSFSIAELREISAAIPEGERIPVRADDQA